MSIDVQNAKHRQDVTLIALRRGKYSDYLNPKKLSYLRFYA